VETGFPKKIMLKQGDEIMMRPLNRIMISARNMGIACETLTPYFMAI